MAAAGEGGQALAFVHNGEICGSVERLQIRKGTMPVATKN